MNFREDLNALVLGVLETGPMHGYEIAKRIRALSDDALSAGEGKLYPALHGLEHDGFIEADWVPQPGKPARKVYALTPDGKAELAKRRKAWRAFSSAVSAILEPQREVRHA